MTSSASQLRELAAYAEKGEVVERLLDHLAGVALKAYCAALRYARGLAGHALLAGLLHDVGKVLKVYQRCYLKREGGACSYVGHEVFSAALAARMLRALELCTARVVVYAVMAHHQYMGPPSSRLEALRSKLRELRRVLGSDPADLLTPVAPVSELVGEAVEGIVERVRPAERDLLTQLVDAAEEADREVHALAHLLLGEPSERLRGTLAEYHPQEMESSTERLKARVLAGMVMAADRYVSAVNRGADQPPKHVKAYIEHAEAR